MSRRLRLSAVLIAAASLSAPASAASQPQTVVSERVSTAGWRAYPVSGQGGWIHIRWNLPAADRPVQVGAWTYTDDDLLFKGFQWTSFQYQDSHRVAVSASPELRVDVDERRNVYGARQLVGVGDRYGSAAAPRTFTLLVWFAGDHQHGTDFELVTDGPVQIGEPTTGDGAFLLTSGDFDAAANAAAQASAPRSETFPNGFGGGARGTVLGSKTFEIEGRLIGSFTAAGALPNGAQANLMLVSNGEWTRDCHGVSQPNCSWMHYAPKGSFANSLPPGAYTFSQTGAGVGIGSFGETLLTVLDVRFPACRPSCLPATS